MLAEKFTQQVLAYVLMNYTLNVTHWMTVLKNVLHLVNCGCSVPWMKRFGTKHGTVTVANIFMDDVFEEPNIAPYFFSYYVWCFNSKNGAKC